MCLLIAKKSKGEIPYSHIEQASYANPHGAGIAWSDGGQVHILKGAKWGADEIASALADIGDAPALVHFRYATHGSLVDRNTHPFQIPAGCVAAHNGMISGIQCRKDESDTRAFLRQIVAPMVRAGNAITAKPFLDKIGKAIGANNKFAFINPSGDIGIANETSGHWVGSVWYSNYGYRPYVAPVRAPSRIPWYSKGYGEYPVERNPVSRKAEKWVSRTLMDLDCMECRADIRHAGLGDSVYFNDDMGVLCDACFSLRCDAQADAHFWEYEAEEMADEIAASRYGSATCPLPSVADKLRLTDKNEIPF